MYLLTLFCSNRVLPFLCGAMTDPEKPVREQAFKVRTFRKSKVILLVTIFFILKVSKGFIEKLEQVSEDPSLKEEMEKEVHSTSSQV